MGFGEHRCEAFYSGDVPASDAAVETRRAIEHVTHVGDERGVPALKILIETFCLVEHVTKIGDISQTPQADPPEISAVGEGSCQRLHSRCQNYLEVDAFKGRYVIGQPEWIFVVEPEFAGFPIYVYGVG